MIRGDDLLNLAVDGAHPSKYHLNCRENDLWRKENKDQWDGRLENLRKYKWDQPMTSSPSKSKSPNKSASKMKNKENLMTGDMSYRGARERNKNKFDKQSGFKTQRASSKDTLKPRRQHWSNISNLNPSRRSKSKSKNRSKSKKQGSKNRRKRSVNKDESVDSHSTRSDKNRLKIEEADYDIFYTYEEMKKLWNNSQEDYEKLEQSLGETLNLSQS